MEQRLEQKQTQILSPQMIQSMEILQMSAQELQEHIEELLLENPVLEQEAVHPQENGSTLLHKLEWLAASSRSSRRTNSDSTFELNNVVAAPTNESLYDHLSAQISWKHLPSSLRRGVECILSGLNDNGWLDETPEELAVRGGVPLEIISIAERIVQTLEPAGIGARTLAQCLELQLTRLGEYGLPLTVVRNHLDDMAKSHFHHIAAVTGASREEVQSACRLIRSLDPRPGAPYTHQVVPVYITPDILVIKAEDQLVVSSCNQNFQELKINSYYQKLLHDSDETTVKEYLSQKIRQADWVIKSISQREQTLLNCAECIVILQEAFFRRGKHFLRPMALADIAEKLNIHESTVSRAVKNKYIQCSWGLFPMSYFFNRALPCNGEEYSAQQIKAALRTLIDGEDKRKPFSDQKLCDLLADTGQIVARRTVAKYRDEMGYPSAPGRKEF